MPRIARYPGLPGRWLNKMSSGVKICAGSRGKNVRANNSGDSLYRSCFLRFQFIKYQANNTRNQYFIVQNLGGNGFQAEGTESIAFRMAFFT